MPVPDRLPRSKRVRRPHVAIPFPTIKRRRPGKSLDDGGVPVEPNRPGSLSGGAAAALEFDE